MTNEELDRARVDEAIRTGNGIVGTVARIAARLAREGWMPPEPVDPDWQEAERLYQDNWGTPYQGKKPATPFFKAIKRGRALERAEAKPGMVWQKWDGSCECPVNKFDYVWAKNRLGQFVYHASAVSWSHITHYAIITQPEEAA